MGLTTDQTLVAESDFNVLCCALPGSGKSHTMISLADNLVNKDLSYKVKLITFTAAAAAELNERLSSKIQGRAKHRVSASTFDSVFGQQVRDGSRIKKKTLIGGAQYNFIERVIRYTNSKLTIDDAKFWIDSYGGMLQAVESPKDNKGLGFKLFIAYQALMERHNYHDFNLIARTAYLSVQSGDSPPLDVTHILIDEFQDTSEIQYAWIQAHGEHGKKVVAVCDDDQSIYSWRGARAYQNMLDFQSDFNAVGYILTKCFRCRPEILVSAKRLIEFNIDRVYKKMESAREPGGTVKVTALPSKAHELENMIRNIVIKNDQWAILARTNRILDDVESELIKHHIPYKRLGSKSLWDNNIACLVLKLFWSLTVNQRDSKYMAELLGWIGESEETIEIIINDLNRNRCPFGDLMFPAHVELHEKTEQLHEKWLGWGTDVRNYDQLTKKLNDIEQFLSSARHLKEHEQGIIATVCKILVNLKVDGGFFAKSKLLCKNLNPKQSKEEEELEQGVVTLSSLHSSKGLQWKQVMIIQSNQGVCPSNAALEDGVEEERRLYYVGMTRAVDELYMTYVQAQGSSPSQFLIETFPEEVEVQKLLLKEDEKQKKIAQNEI